MGYVSIHEFILILLQVMDDTRKVARGFVLSELKKNKTVFSMPFETEEKLEFNSDEVYQLLNKRDYQYKSVVSP